MLSYLKEKIDLIFIFSIASLPFIAVGNFFLYFILILFFFLKEKIPKLDFQTSFLILYILFSIFSIFFSQDFFRSLREGKEIFNFIFYFLFFIYFSKKRKNKYLILSFAIPSLFLSIYGLFEYFLVSEKNYRIHSILSHYMTYSGVLLIYFSVLLSYFLFSKEKKFKNISLISSTLVIPPIFLSMTRNAWVGLFFIVFSLFFILKDKKILISFLIIIILIFLLPFGVGKRLFSIFNLNDETNKDRIFMWKASIKFFLQKPVTGYGLGIPQKDYIVFKEEGGIRYRIPHFHSNIFQILAERGAFALISYLGFILSTLITSFKKIKAWQGCATFLGILGISIAGLFEFNFGDTEVLWLTLCISNLHREVDEKDIQGI